MSVAGLSGWSGRPERPSRRPKGAAVAGGNDENVELVAAPAGLPLPADGGLKLLRAQHGAECCPCPPNKKLHALVNPSKPRPTRVRRALHSCDAPARLMLVSM
jgi:hypothetical protein